MQINSNEYFSNNVFFREWNLGPRGMKRHCPISKKMCAGLFQRFIMVYRMIIGNSSFIHHFSWLIMSFSFFWKKKKKSVITGVLFFCEMSHSASCPDVNKPWDSILRQHWPFMSIKSFEQTQQAWRVTRYGVPICSLIHFNWRVPWPRPARVPLFSLGLKVLRVHVATAGGC